MTLVLSAVGGGVGVVVLTAPAPVTDLSVTASNGAAHARWTAPVLSADMAAITGYQLTATSADGLTRVYTTSASVTAVDPVQLSNGVEWTLSVVALSAAGASTPVSATVTPAATAPEPDAPLPPATTPPGVPTLMALDPAVAAAVVTWAPPADDGGFTIQRYRITAADPAGASISVLMAATAGAALESGTIAPLSNGVTYVVTVTAITSAGESAPSNALTVTPSDTAAEAPPPPQSGRPYVPPSEPVVEAFPALYPMAPAFFMKTAAEASTILNGAS